MSSRRLHNRISTVRVISFARLEKHKLKFHKKSKDGSGKCDAVYVNNKNNAIYGVAFEITTSQLRLLDKYEGLGDGYEQKEVPIITRDGETLDAITYYATDIDSSLKPYGWYKEHVLFGANEHGLPADYIAKIKGIDAISDLNTKRHKEELRIYY